MNRSLGCATFFLFLLSSLAFGQPAPIDPPPGSYDPQAIPAPNQLTPEVLGEMLLSANTFHEVVTNLNIQNSLGPDEHVVGVDGQLHHPIQRSAKAMGAGAGAGAAIGAMTKSQNGILIGALVGGAGGLIIDQILKHREKRRLRAALAQGMPVDDVLQEHVLELVEEQPAPVY